MLTDARNVYVSAASVWEMAFKLALRRLPAPPDVGVWPPRGMDVYRLAALPITLAHAAAVEQPTCHHRDPFHRRLIAQAIAEGLTIVTADAPFLRYPVRLIPC